MNKLKFLILIAILHSWVLSTADEWIIRPGAYESIEHWDDQYFKVSQNGKFGLWNEAGECVVPIEADSITPFYQDRALVLKDNDYKYQILGCLERNGGYTQFSRPYFIFKYYNFFSEGLLPVYDENDDLGYINPTGISILGFDGSYSQIRPFTEGYAVVMSNNDDYYLVNQLGQAQNITFNQSVDIYGLTNVYDGKAYIMKTKIKWWSYDIYTHKTQKETIESRVLDYLYCPACISGRPTKVPYDTKLKKNSYQLVKTDAGLGLIDESDTANSIKVNQDESTIKYYGGQQPYAKFKIETPEKYSDIDLVVKVTEKNGSQPIDYSVEKGEYLIKCNSFSDSISFIVEIEDEGLLLNKSELTYLLQKIDRTSIPLKVSLSTTDNRANENDLVAVVAILSNPGDTEVTTTISLTGSPAFIEKTQKVTIPPNGSKKVTSYFKVTKKLSNLSVIASTDRGESASLKIKELNPFY